MAQKPKLDRITVCPKCDNPNIRMASTFSGWLTQEEWVCDRCGYRGILVKEIEVERK